MPQASLGYVGLANEATPGTGIAPAFFIPATDVSFEAPRENQMVREIRGSRLGYTMLPGTISPAVSLTSKVYPNLFMGVLLHGLFGGGNGQVTTTTPAGGTTSRKHVFSSGSPLPSISFERSDSRTLGQGVIFQRTAGHMIESLNFTAEFGSPLEVTVQTRGTGGFTTPGAKPGAFAYPSVNQMINFTQARVDVDAVQDLTFKSVNFGFTNTFEEQNTLRGSQFPYRIYEGGMECNVSAEIAYEATSTMYTKFVAGTQMSLRLICQGATIEATIPYEFNVYWPKLTVRNFTAPMTAGEIVNASIEFDVEFDDTLGSTAEIFLVNTDSTANIYTA